MGSTQGRRGPFVATLTALFASPAERIRASRAITRPEAERERHVRAVALKLAGFYSVAKIAALEDVSPRTLLKWQRAILAGDPYTSPEAEAIRRIVADRRRTAG
jgi:transposase-like protein